MRERTTDPVVDGNLAAQLLEMVRGYQTTQVIYTAADLGLADLLAAGPKTVEALAQATSTHAPTLSRLLRALASMGIFSERADHQFELTPLGSLLREGVMRAMMLQQGGDMYRAWGALRHSVETGEPAFATVFGVSNWERRRQHPELNAIFNANQGERTRLQGESVAQTYPFPEEGLVVDVGGGNGTLLSIILRHYPRLTGVLFDQPHVIDQAQAVLAAAGVADRCRTEAGDFFQSVPAGGEVYILSHVIGDREDAQATHLLQQCRRAMPPSAKLLLIILALEPGNQYSSLADLHALVVQGGRNRTVDEFRALLAAGGFRLTSIAPLPMQVSLLEALPA